MSVSTQPRNRTSLHPSPRRSLLVPGSLLEVPLALFGRWLRIPAKLWMGYTLLLSGHHFIRYANNLAVHLDSELRKFRTADGTAVNSAFADQASA